MDAAYREVLRAWQTNPHDRETVEALFHVARRRGQTLPPELDPNRVFWDLTETAQAAYGMLDSGGYDHCATGRFFDGGPPYDDPVALRDVINTLYEETVDAPGKSLAYPCLGVQEVARADRLPCEDPNYWADPDGHPTPVASAFARFASEVAALEARYPGLEVFSVGASYPDKGQVFWAYTHLLWLPYHPQTYVLVVQHFW